MQPHRHTVITPLAHPGGMAAADIATPKVAFPPKELKVVLPIRLYVQLHSRKILTGKNICQTVEEALSAYFAQRPLDGGTRDPPPAND